MKVGPCDDERGVEDDGKEEAGDANGERVAQSH